MEPTDNLFGGHSRSGDYGCPAGTFNQLEQEQDLMSLLFLLSESQSPPPAEGFAAPENFGDGQISPMDMDEMPCIPAAVAEETNYAAAPAPLVATHGTGPGQFSYNNFSPSSIAFDDLPFFSEEEVQHMMMSLMAPDGLWNTTNGGPAARSHADAVPPVVQQGTSTTADELPHPQPQLPLLTNDPEAQPGGGWPRLDPSLIDEVQIQQMTLTILAPQPPSRTPVINPGLDEANHAASVPMGSQGTLIAAAPQDQEANMLSRASTRCRAIKSRGLPSRLQVGSDKLFAMGMDMMRQLGRHIGKMLKDEEHRSKVWKHFGRSQQCEYCLTVNVICQYCYTVMRDPSTIELSRHREICNNNIHLLPASSGASKETQRSSQALQIKEIAENPNGESEPIETDNSNCATAARLDTQGTNAGVLSPWQQHQLDREEQMATVLSSQPCCQGPGTKLRWGLARYIALDEQDSWWDLIIRLSDSSYCSSTTKSTHDGFTLFKPCTKRMMYMLEAAGQVGSPRLKTLVKKDEQTVVVEVASSSAWVDVTCLRAPRLGCTFQGYPGVFLGIGSNTIGSSYLTVGVNHYAWKAPALAGYAYPWQCMHLVLCSLGLRKEFARDLVIYAIGRIDECNLRIRRPRSSNRGISIVEQGDDAPSGKRKRKPLPPRSKVWNHFTKEEVEVGGSMVTMAKCRHCKNKLRADSASHGTTHLARHIAITHLEHAEPEWVHHLPTSSQKNY